MSKTSSADHPYFGRSRIAEGAAELLLTLAAAGFTAAIWLSVGAWALPEAEAMQEAAAPDSVIRVTLPTVVIVGQRESPAGTPVATTAQNTAAFPVNLKQ